MTQLIVRTIRLNGKPASHWVSATMPNAPLEPLGRVLGLGLAPAVRSQSRIPLVAAVFPETAFAPTDTIEPVDGLDAGDVLGVLVADVTLDPQPQRRAMGDRQGLAVHAIGENGLGMEGVEQIEAFV